MSIRYALVFACLLLPACASMRPVPWPWPEATKAERRASDEKTICTTPICNAADARRAFSVASNYCSRIIQRHDGDSMLLGSSKLAIGTFGALSGSVISQFAQGSAAKAWSGVSGVTNGVQTEMDQAFSGALDIRRKQKIAEAATEGAKAFEDAGIKIVDNNYDRQVAQAIQMALGCAVNGAKADGTAMQLLNGGASPTGSSSPVEERLIRLRKMLTDGLIDQATYDQEQRRIVGDV